MAIRTHAYALAAAIAFLSNPVVAQSTPDTKVEVKGLRDASKWYRVESQNFIIYSDSRSDGVVELINNLERLDYLLRVYTKPFLLGQGAAPKLTLYFQDRVSWLPELGKRPPEAIGLINSCASGVQAFAFNVDPITAAKNDELMKGTLNESLSYIFEAYARHFIYRHTDIRGPESFIDGFALYFSSVRFTDSQLVVGRAPLGIGRYLHMIDDGAPYQLTFDHVLGVEPMRKPDDAIVQLEFRARSWNLMHYMLSTEQNREKLAQYLGLVHEGENAAKAFATAYGLQGKALNEAMWRYRLAGTKVVHVDVPELPQARMDFATFTGAAGEFVLADAALRSCPIREEGEALLKRLTADAAKVPAVDFAQLALSRAQVDWGNPRDALAWLNGAARRDSGNADIHHLLGVANLTLAERANGAERERLLGAARASLTQAASIKPGAPEVSFALYRAELLGGAEPARTGIARAILAWRQAHAVPAFARSAALAYAWMGDAAGAHRALTVLANNTRDPDNAGWAASWQQRLGRGVARDALLAAMRTESAQDPVFKEWTIAQQDITTKAREKVNSDKSRAYVENMLMGDPSKPETMDVRSPLK